MKPDIELDPPQLGKIAAELEKVRASSGDGLLDPKEVYKFAETNTDSAIYKSLQWDDKLAGYEWRMAQIRQLIIRVKIIHVGDHRPTRLYVSLTTDRVQGSGYRTVTDVLSSPERVAILLEDALAELDKVRSRYDHLKQLAGVWKAVDDVKSKQKKKK